MYSGEAVDEDYEECKIYLPEAGALYAVQQSAAGIDGFVQDLINTGSWETENGDQMLLLPETYRGYPDGWSGVQVQLCAASSVVATSRPNAACAVLKFPMPFEASAEQSVCHAYVQNASSEYARQQAALKKSAAQQAQLQAGGGPAAAARDAPDSKEVFEQKFQQLRASAMQKLAATLASMLRQACRFRGAVPLPNLPPTPARAAAAPGAAAPAAGPAPGPGNL